MTPPELRMVVVNAAKFPRDFIDHRMYCVRCTESDFLREAVHYPAKYIGNYVSKGVRYVAIVQACVRLSSAGNDEVLWKFDAIEDDEAVERAREVWVATKRNPKPCLIFLQTELSATDFVYDHSGGLQSSRIYFDLADLQPTDVKDLARKLREIPWSALANQGHG